MFYKILILSFFNIFNVLSLMLKYNTFIGTIKHDFYLHLKKIWRKYALCKKLSRLLYVEMNNFYLFNR